MTAVAKILSHHTGRWVLFGNNTRNYFKYGDISCVVVPVTKYVLFIGLDLTIPAVEIKNIILLDEKLA